MTNTKMKPDWENVKFGELKIKPNRKLKPCLVCGKIHNYEKYCSKKCYFSQMDKHIVHGMAGTTFYRKWMNIKARCNDPRAVGYKNYGGRGIKLIWKDFRQFYTDMHPSYLEHVKKFGATNTSIDRINNNGNYEKDNCRWATRTEQNNNRRDNIIFSLSEICEALDIKEHSSLAARHIKRGLTLGEALKNKINAKQEEQHKAEMDYIVVKDQKVAEDLVTKYKGKDLKGKWIIIAPDGLEFLSEKDVERLPIIQKLKQQHRKELEGLKMKRRELELVEPRLFQSNPTLNEHGGYSSVPFYCSLCFMSEMDIQDNKLLGGNYHCHCSVWDSPTGGKWLKWFDEKKARQCLLDLPSEHNAYNEAVDEFNKAITNLLKQKGK